MSTFKCKYCGNSLHPEEGQTMVTCERCDEVTRIYTVDNEKKYRMMTEAAELRLHCLFDRAKRRYEAVIEEYPEEGEAYWGYVLCAYGIEFQQDARSGKYLPTLHRISQKSILQDLYYQKALEYANPIDAQDYRRIASELERIRKRFLELSQKEENHYDVFISFKQTDEDTHRETIDSSKAENIYHKLKEKGYRVFFSKITLANRGGEDYEPIIYMALETSKVMLVLGSQKEYLEAPWVRNEWSRFLDMMQEKPEKKILPVLINEMDPGQLPEALQGIQGYNIDTPVGMDRMLSRVRELFPEKKKQEEKSTGKAFGATEESLLKRAQLELDAGRWDNATEYYNRILETNPESAGAWLGLWLTSDTIRAGGLEQVEGMVEQWIENPETEDFYVDFEIKKIKEYEKEQEEEQLIREEFMSRIPTELKEKWEKEDKKKIIGVVKHPSQAVLQKIESFEVGSYFSLEEMGGYLPDDRCFASAREWFEKIAARVQKFFEMEYFQHAMEFSKGKEKERLTEFQENLIQKIADAQTDSGWKEKKEIEELKQEYKKSYDRDSEPNIQEMSEKAKKMRESDYQEACAIKSSKEAENAVELFRKVGDYKDAWQRKTNLYELCQIKDDIGDGHRYLAESVLQKDEQAVINYGNAFAVQKLGEKPEWKNYLCLALYAIYVGMILLAGNVLTFFCIVAGVAAGWYLWKSGKTIQGYIAFAALHMAAGLTIGASVALILGAVYIFSAVWENGYAKYLFRKKNAKIAYEQTKRQIENYEREVKNELDETWQKALGIRYDGVALTPALSGYRFDYVEGTVGIK